MIYVLKHRTQHLLVWNNAPPHVRKPHIIGYFPLYNLTTCFTTQSQCPAFLFFYIIISFFKILMYRSSAEFWGWLRLKGKSYRTFDSVVTTKVLFFTFSFWGFRGSFEAAAQQPPPPRYVRLWHSDYCTIAQMFSSPDLLLLLLLLLFLFIFWTFYTYYFSIKLASTLKLWYITSKFRIL